MNIMEKENNLKSWEGIIPVTTKCEICQKEIWYNHKEKVMSIHFDLSNKRVSEIKYPMQWLSRNPKSKEAMFEWDLCCFGYLCYDCYMAFLNKDKQTIADSLNLYVRKQTDAAMHAPYLAAQRQLDNGKIIE